MASEYNKRSAKVGLLRQTAWATPIDATGAFALINADAGSIKINSAVTVDEFQIADGGGLMPAETRRYTDGVSGLPTIGYTFTPTKLQLAQHLVAAFQKCTEAATTPWAKQISPANAFIDFNGDAGFLWTLAVSPSGVALADGIILENAILNEFELSIDALANGTKQLMQANCTWIGNEMNFAQTLSGTLVAAPTNTATFLNTSALGFTLNLLVGSADLDDVCWRRFSMKLSNGVYSDCKTTGGKAKQYKMNPSLIFTIDIPYTTTTKETLGAYKAGSNIGIEFSNGTGAADGTLAIAFAKGTLIREPFEYEGDYHSLRLEVRADKPSAGFAVDSIKFTDTLDGTY
jgi:hypothetical protein